MQTITRKFEFDAGHRLVGHPSKCANIHGHRYVAEIDFVFGQLDDIGYAMDFGEIKRRVGLVIDSFYDHAMVLNGADITLAKYCQEQGYKFHIMSLADNCNPTAENMAKEILLIAITALSDIKNIVANHVKLYETPNCWSDVDQLDIPGAERAYFLSAWEDLIIKYTADVKNK